jgi:hypothetical protein
VFVDQFSKWGYVHLQSSNGAEEMIQAKEAFETAAWTYGVTIQHYHADNGIFADNQFERPLPTTTRCYHSAASRQNGVAEKRICNLTELAQTMLIHANPHCPLAVYHYLWLYAL